jgi:hypothetical protein
MHDEARRIAINIAGAEPATILRHPNTLTAGHLLDLLVLLLDGPNPRLQDGVCQDGTFNGQ